MHPVAFVVGQLETARRYYTDAGLVSAIVVAAALLVFRWPPAAFLLGDAGDGLLHRLLAITGGAALAYVLAAPTWARIHAYWQFYALPFVVLAMLVVGRALLRLGRERGSLLARALLAIFVVDTVIGSASTLYFRHTTRSAHTMRQVAELRANAMVPAYLGERGAPAMTPVRVRVNGREHSDVVPPRLLLCDFLRTRLRLTGTHVGCEHGVCGACTVLLDGEPVRSCLLLAVQASGREITTVEGLAPDAEHLHPIQQAFHEEHGLQCGFCTPGFLMTVTALLRRHPRPTDEEIRVWLRATSAGARAT